MESELEALPRPGGARPRPLDDAARERYLQLPALLERIAELARRVTAGSADGGESARRLTT